MLPMDSICRRRRQAIADEAGLEGCECSGRAPTPTGHPGAVPPVSIWHARRAGGLRSQWVGDADAAVLPNAGNSDDVWLANCGSWLARDDARGESDAQPAGEFSADHGRTDGCPPMSGGPRRPCDSTVANIVHASEAFAVVLSQGAPVRGPCQPRSSETVAAASRTAKMSVSSCA